MLQDSLLIFSAEIICLCEKSILKESLRETDLLSVSFCPVVVVVVVVLVVVVSGRLRMKHVVLQPLNPVHSVCFNSVHA